MGAKAEAEQARREEGWKAAFNESVLTERGDLSSGVGIGARSRVGMGAAPPGPAVPRDRAAARWVSCGVPGGFLAISAHLAAAAGPDAGPKIMLGQLGRHLAHAGVPFCHWRRLEL